MSVREDLEPDAAMIAAFRQRMDAFVDDVEWPDSVIEWALCEGVAKTSRRFWGRYEDKCKNFRQRGIFFYAAHWMAVMYPNGGAAGQPANSATRLNPASKQVGDENMSYRVSAIQDADDDWLSTTNFGIQYYKMRKVAAMGAIAV